MDLSLASRPSKVVVVGFLLTCLFLSGAESYFCPECGPAGMLSASSLSRDILRSDEDGPGQDHSGACPVCLNPLLVNDDMPTFLTALIGVFQDPPLPSSVMDITIYRPPRIAS